MHNNKQTYIYGNEAHETKQLDMHQQGERQKHKSKKKFPKLSPPFCLNIQKHSPHFVC